MAVYGDGYGGNDTIPVQPCACARLMQQATGPVITAFHLG